jgi:prepilin-type N-terminal cleavage/methylation domain-containing protein
VRPTSDTHTVMLERIREIAACVRRRLASEDAFTLVELTIVLLILGILLTIAVPSYLSFKDKAAKTAAQSDVAVAVKSVIAYGADNFPSSQNDPDPGTSTSDSGYDNINLTFLATKYDASIPTTPGAPYVMNPAGFTGTTTDFCLTAAVGRWVAVQHGPGTGIQVGTLFTPGTCTVS